VLRRRWWVVLAITLICLVGAFGYILTASKVYTASSLIYVSPTGAGASNQVANSRTGSGSVNLDTEAQILTSGTVATMAGKILHSSQTPYQLSHSVTVSVPPNSQTLLIACNASSSSGAAACANAFATAYLQNRSAAAAAALNAQLKSLNSQITALGKKISALNGTVASFPKNSPQATAALAQLTPAQATQKQLTSSLGGIESALANTSGGYVLTKATNPGSPSAPKKSLVLPSGVAVGLLLGLIAAFIRDRADKRIHGARDVERFFDVPAMLSLPKTAFGRTVSLASPRSRTGKAFTDLAHDVAASLGEGSHVIVVAGTLPGPGVSVVAANLAATLARTHSEAVLVCAALRDSVAPELFGLTPSSRGLAEVIAGRATVGEVARGPAGVPGLWVIPPGADTSLAEQQVQHDTAKALITQLRRDTRYVVIEVQASDDGSDIFSLAEFADGALLTVEVQRTRRNDVEVCMQRLRRMRTPLLGAAVIPALRSDESFRPPRPSRPGSGPDDRRELERDEAAGARDRGGIPGLSGTSVTDQQDRQLVRPSRTSDGYGDPADRISGN
jgi:capsular polysaccharide biosynthesis protein